MNALEPRDSKHVPSIKGLVNPDQVGRHLDAVAPPIELQAAETLGRIVREQGLIAEPTGEHNGQPTMAISTPDGQPLYEGSITSEESVERLRLGLGFVAARDGHEQPHKDIDDILFGTGAHPIISGEVVRPQTADTPQHATHPAPTAARRHAREKQPGKWRRRVVASAMATVALVGAFFSGDSGTSHHEAMPRPSATATPQPEAQQDTPQPTTAHRTIGHNTFDYAQTANGTITSVTGHLGQGESPWTLTEDAFTVVHQEASPRAIASADYYMGVTALKEAAKNLPQGSTMTWRVSVTQGKKSLTPVLQ